MNKRSWLRCLPLALALGFVCVPAAQAADIGQQIEQEYGVVRDDTREGAQYNQMLNDVVTRVVRSVNSDKEYKSFQLRGARLLGGKDTKHDKVINAFALPDGRIYVTLGLMRILDNSPRPEDELSFVVGHEVTHVIEKHSAKQAKKALPYNIAAILLGAVTKNQTVGAGAGLYAAAKGASFSRRDEYAADRGGLIFMTRAGYEPDAAVSMLGRLKSAAEGGGGPSAWFASHPQTQNRINKVKDMIQDIKAGRRPDPND